jgi:hypothetical protein
MVNYRRFKIDFKPVFDEQATYLFDNFYRLNFFNIF